MDNEKEMKEDAIELKETSANENADTDMPAAAPMPAAQPAAPPAAQPAAPKKAAGWWEKNVTRKFLSIALAAALALNVVLSAGIMKLLGPSRGFDKRGSGRPGSEQQFDNGRGGRNNMMPPSGNQQPGGQQNQQPDTQQNQQNQQSSDQQNQQPENQQNGSQQSEKQDSSQEKA